MRASRYSVRGGASQEFARARQQRLRRRRWLPASAGAGAEGRLRAKERGGGRSWANRDRATGRRFSPQLPRQQAARATASDSSEMAEPALEGADAPPPEAPAPSQAQASKSRDPNRPLTFRYWSRPTHLQYKYLYDYRHNYYNDVIDYLDRRSRGLTREIPRPQTWAERALRTYTSGTSEATIRRQKDVELLSSIRSSNYSYQYHARDSMIKRYPALSY